MATDRLSSLTDEIICQILSFLHTKQAVATTILSKRWIHLWRFVPVLDFSNTSLQLNLVDYYRFNELVLNILFERELADSRSIHTFILNIEYNSHQVFYHDARCITNINKWINYAGRCKVQYLNLSLHPYNYLENRRPQFPISILNCTTLVVLNLRCFAVHNIVPFTLPTLKTLHLNDMYFYQDRDFMNLLAGCPVLEDLQLSHVCCGSVVPYDFQHFESSSLTKLNKAIITASNFCFPVKALSNLEFLCIRLWKDYHPYDFPTFNNLTHLVLNYDWDIVLQVLQHCPKLQNLNLYQKLLDGWEYENIAEVDQENWADPGEFVPCCLSSNLTTCTFWGFAFAGLQRHIMLASFILKNARVLQTMTILCSRERSEIESQLSICPRASATCQLSIY